MSNDVERLAGIITDLGEDDALIGRVLARRIARRLLDEGVTLPTPPRATPLEAATRNRVLMAGCDWGSMLEIQRREWLRATASDITAAVGALSDEDVRQIGQAYVTTPFGTSDADRTRAALLARLTEGGTA